MATRSHSEPTGRALTVSLVALALASPVAADAEPLGNAAAGRQLFEERCQGCHTLGSLAGKGDLVQGDLRRINDRMSVVGLLWNQEVSDLEAFLNSVPRPTPK